MMEHVLIIREVDRRVFDAISSGQKHVETRKASDKYLSIKEGDSLIFVCGSDKIRKTVLKTYHFQNIEEMLEIFNFKEIMPFANSIQEMKSIYYSFPGYKEEIEKNGLLGIVFE